MSMEYHFSDLFTWTSGKPISPSEGTIPVYGSNGIIGFTNKAKYCNRIILGRVGAYCGSVAYCPTEFDATDNTLITTCDTSKILYHYAYFLLKLFNLNVYAGGAAQPLITQGLLKHLKCSVPSLDNQQLIVDILSAYDNLIEVNNKRIKVLEQMAENLYKEWFVRFRFPGYESAEFENGIPKGWNIKRISEVGEVVGGGTPSTECPEYWDGNIPWLTPADLASFEDVYISSGSSFITDEGLRKSSAQLLPKDTVLLSSRAPIGYVAIAQVPLCTNQGFKSVICNTSTVNPLFLFYFFKNNKELLECFASGSTFLELSGGRMKKIKLIVPPISVQNTFAETISPWLNMTVTLRNKNNNLIKQRDLLLPRLMSGKLEV